MLVGMGAGVAVLVGLWWTGAVAWTWYAFIGASVTAVVAVAFHYAGRLAGEPVRT
jgi:hypothetical protein